VNVASPGENSPGGSARGTNQLLTEKSGYGHLTGLTRVPGRNVWSRAAHCTLSEFKPADAICWSSEEIGADRFTLSITSRGTALLAKEEVASET